MIQIHLILKYEEYTIHSPTQSVSIQLTLGSLMFCL